MGQNTDQQCSSFEQIRDKLLGEIGYFRRPSETTAGSPLPFSKERDVFGKHDDLLEDLYIAAPKQRKDLGKVTQSNLKSDSRSFRGAIIGNEKANSCAKILAILLSIKVDPAGNTWARFLDCFNLNDRSSLYPDFCDNKLPLLEDDIERYLGGDDLQNFESKQHDFCPVDLTVHFEEICTKLRKLLDSVKYLTQCQIIGEGGEDNNSQRDVSHNFCPDSDSSRFVQACEGDVKQLYIESYKAWYPQKPSAEPRTQRKFIEEAKRNAECFFDGLRTPKPRVKILATLILTSMTADSLAWQRFTEICIKSTVGFYDEDLPLALNEIKRHLGDEESPGESFRNSQYRFCAIKLEVREQVEILDGPKVDQRLPLLEKQEIDRGSSGKVFRVKVKAGYLIKDDRELAMKVLDTNAQNSGEWESAKRFFRQLTESHNIMRAVASLKTPKHIYIFFPKANCNLRKYMTKLQTSGPADFQHRRKMFKHIIGIAKALNYLHLNLQDERREERMVCIHGDLKADNILLTYTSSSDMIFQIADFGISSIKIEDSEHEWSNLNDSEHGGCRMSPRVIPTQTFPGNNCPNYAPEAAKNGAVDTRGDIWGFGTVFAEYISWLAGGESKLRAYEKARFRSSQGKGDELSFCTDKDGTQMLKKGIQSWFLKLITETHHHEDKLLYEKSWLLLLHGLLICNPAERISVDVMCRVLQDIYNSRDIDVRGICETSQSAKDSRLSNSQNSNGNFSLQQDDQRQTSLRTPNSKQGEKSTARSSSGPPKTQHGYATRKPWDIRMPNFGRTPALHSPIEDAAKALKDEDLDSFRDALSKVAEIDGRVNGKTLLEMAMEKKSDKMVVILIEKDAKIDLAKNNGRPLLHQAASSGMIETVRTLLQRDMNTEVLDDWKHTPLLRALEEKHADVAALLLVNGASVNIPNALGYTALHYAVECKEPDAVQKLLSDRKEMINKRDNDGQTPLHLCARMGDKYGLSHATRIMGVTGESYRANLNSWDKFDRSPLYFVTDQVPNQERLQMANLLIPPCVALKDLKLGKFSTQYGLQSRGRSTDSGGKKE